MSPIISGGGGSGGSSSYTDALWIHANPAGTTFAGNVNEAFAFADLAVSGAVGTDLSLVEFVGQPGFQTAAGGTFRVSVGLDITPTLNAGSALQRVMQFDQSGYGPQIHSGITMPFVMADGVEITADFPGPELLNLPAGTVFGQAPTYVPLNSIAADSYYVFYNAMAVRLA